MQAFPAFRQMSPSFWALIKFISETLGYTDRRTKSIRTYSQGEITALLTGRHIAADPRLVEAAAGYCARRADLLNDFVRVMLMDGEAARAQFEALYPVYLEHRYRCKLPMNKQSGKMKRVNYFTAIVNILAERTIRAHPGYDGTLGFDDDPRGLVYILDGEGRLAGASSRRFDGACPGVMNPRLVWEIKEYYYATTFGSRVADGVYETQLDGHEFREIKERTGAGVLHVFLIDAYKTWWVDGRSYLCRIVDALNAGLVDEVIVGREVLTRWPQLLRSVLDG